ncbi:MAG TPA: 3-beta hydroxysteroid dehydrogenase, partial [Candidatus Sericytochromatia bacterium]
GVTRFFEWGWNIADRLSFAEVIATGKPLDAPMDDVYRVFGIDPKELTTLEAYLQEYFGRILKKLKELDTEKAKKKKSKRKLTF